MANDICTCGTRANAFCSQCARPTGRLDAPREPTEIDARFVQKLIADVTGVMTSAATGALVYREIRDLISSTQPSTQPHGDSK